MSGRTATRRIGVALLLVLISVSGCYETCARRKKRHATLRDSFVAERSDGSPALVIFDSVLLDVGKGAWPTYYRLRSIDAEGRELARVAFAPPGAMDCAPARGGRFWCVHGHGHEIVLRDVDTLEVARDFASLQDGTRLAAGLDRVRVDYAAGELHVTTGQGDYVILRAATAEVVDTDQIADRFIPLGRRATEDGGVALDHLTQKPIISDSGIALTHRHPEDHIELNGHDADGHTRWSIEDAPGEVLNAYQIDDRALVVVARKKRSYVLSISLTTGAVDWRYEL